MMIKISSINMKQIYNMTITIIKIINNYEKLKCLNEQQQWNKSVKAIIVLKRILMISN